METFLAIVGLLALVAAAWWGGWTSGLRRGAETYRDTLEERLAAVEGQRSRRGIRLASLKIRR